MREYDVTPQEQGSECIHQAQCQYYKFGIYCNECTQYDDFENYIYDDEDNEQ